MHVQGIATVAWVFVSAGSVIAGPAARRGAGQSPAPKYSANATRANAVKNTFQIAWDGYHKYAFPHDSLMPVTNKYADER